MDREIDELAEVIEERLEEAKVVLGSMNKRKGYWIATALVEAGYRKADELIAENEKLKTSLEEAIRSFTRMETLYKVKCQELENKENKMSDIQELCEENISCLQELLSNESRILRLLQARQDKLEDEEEEEK